MMLVGIMAGKKGKKIIGNIPLFKALQKELINKGGIAVVFTPEGLHEKGLEGYLFQPKQNTWLRVKTPLPHLIYNRLPKPKMERDPSFQKALTIIKKKQIPFFNPCFLNKLQAYHLLRNDPILKDFLPETIEVDDMNKLSGFLTKHKRLYMKPAQASRGRGVFKLQLIKDGTIEYADRQKTVTYRSFHQAWQEIQTFFHKQTYLAQAEIRPFSYKGKRYDYRILVQHDGKHHGVTGVGIRQASLESITTHVHYGGKLIPYEKVMNKDIHDLIEEAAYRVGKALSEEFGFFGEFSIDAGLGEDGHFWIFEVNSKPMSFDEESIEQNRIKQCVQLFVHTFKKGYVQMI